MTDNFILREPEMLGLFILLIPFVALAFYHIRRRNSDLHAFIPSKPGKIPMNWYQKGRILLSSLGLALMIFSLSRPANNPHPEQLYKKGRDLVFLLDVSNSMLARDLAPNRLERAKTYIQDCVASLENHRFGLVIFAGSASIKCPLTTDLEFFLSTLQSSGPDSVAHGGTRISDAILKTCDKIFSQDNDSQNIILISDGGNQAKSLKTAIETINNKKIRLFCLGIGDSLLGARIPDQQNPGQFLKENNQEIWTKLETDKMQSLVRSCKGAVYIPAGTKNLNLAEVYRDLQKGAIALQKSSHENLVYDDIFHYFLFVGLLLFTASIFVPEQKNLAKMAIFCLLLISGNAFAQEQADEYQNLLKVTEESPDTENLFALANNLYKKEKFLQAAENYRKALTFTQNRSERVTLIYNQAVSMHKAALSDKAQKKDDSAPVSLELSPSAEKLVFINQSIALYRAILETSDSDKYLENLVKAVKLRADLLARLEHEAELMKKFEDAVVIIREKLEEALAAQIKHIKIYTQQLKAPSKNSLSISDAQQKIAQNITKEGEKMLSKGIKDYKDLVKQANMLHFSRIFVENALKDQQNCLDNPHMVDKEPMTRRAKQELEKAITALTPQSNDQSGKGDSEEGEDSGEGEEGEDGEEGDEDSENMNAADLDSSELAERDSQNMPEPQDSAEDLIKREKQLQKSRMQNMNRGGNKKSKQGVTW